MKSTRTETYTHTGGSTIAYNSRHTWKQVNIGAYQLRGNTRWRLTEYDPGTLCFDIIHSNVFHISERSWRMYSTHVFTHVCSMYVYVYARMYVFAEGLQTAPPQMVTLEGSPPKDRMLSLIHSSACRWSCIPYNPAPYRYERCTWRNSTAIHQQQTCVSHVDSNQHILCTYTKRLRVSDEHAYAHTHMHTLSTSISAVYIYTSMYIHRLSTQIHQKTSTCCRERGVLLRQFFQRRKPQLSHCVENTRIDYHYIAQQ